MMTKSGSFIPLTGINGDLLVGITVDLSGADLSWVLRASDFPPTMPVWPYQVLPSILAQTCIIIGVATMMPEEATMMPEEARCCSLY